MKKGSVVASFIVLHIAFIFAHIHKNMRYIRLSFEKQKKERLVAQLKKDKQEATNQLYALQNKSQIKEFAQDTLNMRPIKLSQIKRVSDD